MWNTSVGKVSKEASDKDGIQPSETGGARRPVSLLRMRVHLITQAYSNFRESENLEVQLAKLIL